MKLDKNSQSRPYFLSYQFAWRYAPGHPSPNKDQILVLYNALERAVRQLGITSELVMIAPLGVRMIVFATPTHSPAAIIDGLKRCSQTFVVDQGDWFQGLWDETYRVCSCGERQNPVIESYQDGDEIPPEL